MSFETKDNVRVQSMSIASTLEDIVFHRNRDLPGVKMEIHIVFNVIEDGRQFQVVKKVPAFEVDLVWTGAFKTKMLGLADVAI